MLAGSIASHSRGTLAWEEMALGSVLPEPPTNKGTLYENSAETLSITLDKVSDDQYQDYVLACAGKGFTADRRKRHLPMAHSIQRGIGWIYAI